ncbi:putative histamine N-monooxygenase [Marinomonas mediterranea]|jgi:Lysine/ornithine N-monooxygenase|uniref:L-lysine 6-monooxygenase (NADPH) n=1 Tax=Marinomonas mediterranea (strain ATCC 700492 / JCM 21426 / NBRC 103028 / MMB-1) TaxID=717774 RepID=F2JYE1_MARM1|nr:putative histamine N-monooxygenase [Marinomonas mediterranea]ADZ91972.1 L-lysine 6-monooxygenase (NADPH) [Marinomonas mediterranea MMB-1]WCN09922.1 putative histamine N-monooxygenase [Marinomonas mediterranea]WCN14004.1 putative histamine N-monooxygenase [Marinomonas mediterranea]WCN18051.1 putative histamine N-monooxygenase [Marinomonas mediterranea MMB-1]
MDINNTITGIGLGPFNLGLAALLSKHSDIESVFLERNREFNWHKGLLLSGTTLQVPFFADLVTMADPCHKLSYLNYLHQQDRLYQFYYYESFLIPRVEYNHYCRWAVDQLENCHFGENVSHVSYDDESDLFTVHSELASGQTKTYSSRHLAVGVGTQPNIPQWLAQCDHPLARHASEFADLQETLMQCQKVTVVGSGQSAAECVLALFRSLTPEQVDQGASIRWITQSAGYHPMEYSKLGQECFTPAYMDYFQTLTRDKRREVASNQGLLYKGISCSTISDIFDLLYERSIGGRTPGLTLSPNCSVKSIKQIGLTNGLKIECEHTQLKQTYFLESDAVIAATGYKHHWPSWLEQLKGSVLETDANNDFIVNKDFSAQRCDSGRGKIFIQNPEIYQQGVGGPDLGIGAYRNAHIINQVLDKPYYRISKSTAFQNYGIPEDATLCDFSAL